MDRFWFLWIWIKAHVWALVKVAYLGGLLLFAIRSLLLGLFMMMLVVTAAYAFS
ncbi:hypothetical protein GCM10007870_08250 [Gluconobacter kondonii]|uniref:Uncharacterized protein n=1 Tax=Gluconobacter kondonii TaxID=941463 RepID=A0ABQ5WP78_9PROT|nr:hypothetical protein GCM10007870_08250 [Gluconobacter kondonii]